VIGYLLDTNILSQLVRAPRGSVADRMSDSGGSTVCATSVVVAGEMRFGALKRGSARLQASVEAVLDAITILPLDVGADRHYGTIRFELERTGRIIGANDLWIAAQALACDVTLVTDNISEFGQVAGLRLENWLTEAS
jgi:tRNA(fMet)-specific endonuclease VapC